MKLREVYMIHEVDESNYKIVKVLNEYANKAEAQAALSGLLTNNTTEKDLLKEFSKKK